MRLRREPPKVWHNPEIAAPRRGGRPNAATPNDAADARSSKQHRAALDALFAPRPDPAAEPEVKKRGGGKPAGRIVLRPPPTSDPKVIERQRLLAKLLGAEGRPKVSKAADEFLKAGHTFPEEQDVYLQLLEHENEEHVCNAMDRLTSILAGELPKRRAVLESRLRRIEQFADEAPTRASASKLRKFVTGRGEARAPEPRIPNASEAPPPRDTPGSDDEA